MEKFNTNAMEKQINCKFFVPEVFTNPDFEYIGTYKEKKKLIKIDMMFWMGLCTSGQWVKGKDFNRATKLMGDTLKHDDYMTIMEEVNNL